MAELIHPLDRELRRQTQRNDGFSNDGLSYSVANDMGKLWGQAMAEYEAREAAPRNDAFGVTLAEDRPENLRASLIDPLIQRFAAPSAGRSRTPAPRTYKVGNQTTGERVVSVDPLTGKTTEIYTSEAAPKTERPDPRDLIDYRMAASRLEQANRDYADAIPSRKADALKVLDEARTALESLRTPKLESAPTPALTEKIQTDIVNDELAPVINPNGKPTKIKASQLDAAMKQGYKRR